MKKLSCFIDFVKTGSNGKAGKPKVINPDYVLDYRVAKLMLDDYSNDPKNQWMILELMLALSRDCLEVLIACIRSIGLDDSTNFRQRCLQKIEMSTSAARLLTVELSKSFGTKDYVKLIFKANSINYQQIDCVNLVCYLLFNDKFILNDKNACQMIVDEEPELSDVIYHIETLYDNDDINPRQWAQNFSARLGELAVLKTDSVDDLELIYRNLSTCDSVRLMALEKMLGLATINRILAFVADSPNFNAGDKELISTRIWEKLSN